MEKDHTLRDRVITLLEKPTTKIGIGLHLGMLLVIYASVSLLIIEARYPDIAKANQNIFESLNHIILFIFVLDLLVRLIVFRDRLSYIMSFGGLIDIVAVLPGLAALALPGAPSLAWLRVLRIVRIMRFMRLAKIAQKGTKVGAVFGGIAQRLMPWVALAAGLKGLVLAAEGQKWWPGMGDLDVVVTVAGFAISVLLGAKLSVVQSRFYDVEDAICRILGAVTDMKKTEKTEVALADWVYEFKKRIVSNSDEQLRELKNKTYKLEETLESEGVGGPVTAGFHKDLEFLVHRLRVRTPPFLEQFLRVVTLVYSSVAIFAVPGFTGFFMVLLIVFVLGGMYFLIDDLDNPLPDNARPLMGIDLTPLNEYVVASSESSASEYSS